MDYPKIYDTNLIAQVESLTVQITTFEGELNTATTTFNNEMSKFNQLTDKINNTETQLEAAISTEQKALEDSANRTVTEEVSNYFNTLFE